MIFCPECSCPSDPDQTSVVTFGSGGLIVGALCHCGHTWMERTPRVQELIELAVRDFERELWAINDVAQVIVLWEDQDAMTVPMEAEFDG